MSKKAESDSWHGIYKEELVRKIAKYQGENISTVEEYWDMIVDTLIEEILESHERPVVITGLGKFELNKVEGHNFYNIHTEETDYKPTHLQLSFSASPKLRHTIKDIYGNLEDE